MTIANHIIELETAAGIEVYDITTQIRALVSGSGIQNGQVLIFSRHTTTALAINEFESRLIQDAKTYLRKLAPETDPYLHNDLHLRPNIPPDEPMNAHSHLMAMTLSTSEIIPIADGKLALGTYQSVMLFELDGPRRRSVFCQISGA
jgi:secondary thiamine-phosphate synthase enzyme